MNTWPHILKTPALTQRPLINHSSPSSKRNGNKEVLQETRRLNTISQHCGVVINRGISDFLRWSIDVFCQYTIISGRGAMSTVTVQGGMAVQSIWLVTSASIMAAPGIDASYGIYVTRYQPTRSGLLQSGSWSNGQKLKVLKKTCPKKKKTEIRKVTAFTN